MNFRELSTYLTLGFTRYYLEQLSLYLRDRTASLFALRGWNIIFEIFDWTITNACLLFIITLMGRSILEVLNLESIYPQNYENMTKIPLIIYTIIPVLNLVEYYVLSSRSDQQFDDTRSYLEFFNNKVIVFYQALHISSVIAVASIIAIYTIKTTSGHTNTIEFVLILFYYNLLLISYFTIFGVSFLLISKISTFSHPYFILLIAGLIVISIWMIKPLLIKIYPKTANFVMLLLFSLTNLILIRLLTIKIENFQVFYFLIIFSNIIFLGAILISKYTLRYSKLKNNYQKGKILKQA